MRYILSIYLFLFFLLFATNTFAVSHYKNVLTVSTTNPQVEIIAYPNPFHEGISLEIITINTKPTELRIFDIIGTERERVELSQFGSMNVYRIELKNLPAGIYFCNVYADKKLLESKKITCTH
ncbi:MAG: T9SS C-terminal target domain-containing protein [Bacteroidetes bacterium]|nr:MAG: T9SS C-terminal target domain-containing protein [Bacteroidota bacterium]